MSVKDCCQCVLCTKWTSNHSSSYIVHVQTCCVNCSNIFQWYSTSLQYRPNAASAPAPLQTTAMHTWQLNNVYHMQLILPLPNSRKGTGQLLNKNSLSLQASKPPPPAPMFKVPLEKCIHRHQQSWTSMNIRYRPNHTLKLKAPRPQDAARLAFGLPSDQSHFLT